MRSLVVVRCFLIVCLVSQIGPRIRISDNGRHDADEVQLFHGVIPWDVFVVIDYTFTILV